MFPKKYMIKQLPPPNSIDALYTPRRKMICRYIKKLSAYFGVNSDDDSINFFLPGVENGRCFSGIFKYSIQSGEHNL